MYSHYLILISTALAVSAKTLWSTQPAANFGDVIREAYPVGNGWLGALPFNVPGYEKLSINYHNLWTGGPFENASYNGGNPTSPVWQNLAGIQELIFSNGTGNGSLTPLMSNGDNYGSYAVLGNLSVWIDGVTNQSYSHYNRSLDLTTGIHTTTFIVGGNQYTSKVYCSYPDSVCVYDLASTGALPAVGVWLENGQLDPVTANSTCSTASKYAGIVGQIEPGLGMTFNSQARLVGSDSNVSCSSDGTLMIAGRKSSLTLVLAAGTNYDESAGTAAMNYSFRGPDPAPYVEQTAAQAASKPSDSLMSAHVADFTALTGAFSLDLPDTANSAGLQTADVIGRFSTNMSDPFLESMQFDYGRYLFISSSRNGTMPPNLQGKWAYSLSNAWGADYHVDINLQMNHWVTDQTGLGEIQTPLWNYLIQTWAPRGTESAKLIYDAPGFVAQGYVNEFGATGMMTGDEYWANLPMSGAWLMLHAADHFDYSQDVAWLTNVGYPQLLKPISQFWINQLVQDQYFKDGTLVSNPCDSPEHGPTTFGCTHYQQLFHSLFTNTLNYSSIVGDTDTEFVSDLTKTLALLDTGLHIGSWGQVQEWKLDLDIENDTHRHLSNLIGWFPGTSLSSLHGGYTNETIQNAVATTLWSRGPGIADANAGWEKVWRGACWARLNNTIEAYYELRLTLQENIANNLLSMYSGKDEPFQIDANFGFVGNVLSMLVVDLPARYAGETRDVVLGPAIPPQWAGGSVKGLRLRGNGEVDFDWDDQGIVRNVSVVTKPVGSVRIVNVLGDELWS